MTKPKKWTLCVNSVGLIFVSLSFLLLGICLLCLTGRIEEMGSRVDELEKNLNDLMNQVKRRSEEWLKPSKQ